MNSQITDHDNVAYAALANNNSETDSDSDSYYNAPVNKRNGKDRESIKLMKVDRSKTRTRPFVDNDSGEHVMVSRSSSRRTVCFWTCAFILAISIGLALAIIGIPHLFGSTKKPVLKPGLQTPPWSKVYNDWELSGLRTVDVDDDGRDDIIFSITRPINHNDYQNNKTIEKFCKAFSMSPPCMGALVAVRGYDGKELWRTYVDSELFEISCSGIDINKDGKDDCLVAGRVSTVAAVDPKNGQLLWKLGNKYLKQMWNTYLPLVLPDVNGDGIPDLLVTHGGDPAYPPEIHDRHPGRLFLISGVNGEYLGHRYYSIPESKETYMSPVLHHRKDGTPYILFGSGGETVPGCLYGISVADFYRHVFNMSDSDPVPETIKTAEMREWGKIKPGSEGVYEIVRTHLKGVMVPPVLVDMDKDGINDILVTTFDGSMILLNGESLERMWVRAFKAHETYSTPAPGYFNDDNVLDFMIHWNHGAWPEYTTSIATIVDGRDGSSLWTLNSSHYEVSSDLVAMTTHPHLDAFISRISGKLGSTGQSHNASGQSHNAEHESVHKTQRTQKRHGAGPEDNKMHPPHCLDEDLPSNTVGVYMLTRLNTHQLLKITELLPEKYYYNSSTEPDVLDKRHAGEEHDSVGEDANSKTLCTLLEPNERVTGLLGDFDGDDELDLVLPLAHFGRVKTAEGSYIRMKFLSKLVKINLKAVLNERKLTEVYPLTKIKDHLDHLKNINFRKISQQHWPGYLGRGNSIYGRK